MNLLIYLIVAALIGWVATELMHDRSNLILNIVVAVVGASWLATSSALFSKLEQSMMRSPFQPCWSHCWDP